MSDSFQDAVQVSLGMAHSEQLESFSLLLDDAMSRSHAGDMASLFIGVAKESVPLGVSRSVFSAFASAITTKDSSFLQAAAVSFIDATMSRAVAFEEQITHVREALADSYQQEEAYTEAARALSGISLDSGQRMVKPLYKLQIYVRIARLYLEDEDNVEAERYLNRASDLIPLVDDKKLLLAYRASFVRVLDFKRQFLKASLKYFHMSHESLLSDEGQMQALDSAHKCAILSEAGPQRQRLLATLYKDERSSRAESFLVLEKMYLDRILTIKEVETFSKTLQDHQLASLADGSTVLERAVMEHNVLSSSKLYQNVTFDHLGAILGIDAEKAEKTCAKMMLEGRLEGSIDQVDRLIHFQTTREESDALARWDAHIHRACGAVNDILAHIADAHPKEFAALGNASS